MLDSANLALQDAQRRLLTELEQERKHLAREIHDQIIQVEIPHPRIETTTSPLVS